MSNKRITDLTELTNPTSDDVFPVVDIATNTTTKVQLGNLPVPSSVTTALATKQDSLVSGTNIKTINSTSVLGSGNIAVQPTLVSGTSIKTVNSNSLLGSGDVAVQETLVSGTNIKTLNNTSLLGSGNITLTANPSGVAGAIQFSNGSAFASDAANLFWDDANNRLGVGTNAPSHSLEVRSTNQTDVIRFKSQFAQNGYLWTGNTQVGLGSSPFGDSTGNHIVLNNIGALIGAGGQGTATAKLQIVGSGSTSATTSLLVQNSAGTNIFKIGDSARIDVLGTIGQIDFSSYYQIFSTGNQSTVGCYKGGQAFSVDGSRLCVNVATSSHSASASFQVDSTTTGILPPRMTTTQKNAISSPAAGLVVYDNTTNKLQCYNGSTWNDLF